MAGENQKIVVVLDIPGQNEDQQNQVNEAVEEAGLGKPEGRLYHVSCVKEGGIMVVEVWESDDHRNRFLHNLMPILHKLGFPLTEPEIYPVQTIISGS